MDILFGIIVFISGPIFYITGLIVFVRWVARRGVSANASAAQLIRQTAATQPHDVAQILLKLADQIADSRNTVTPLPVLPTPTASLSPSGHSTLSQIKASPVSGLHSDVSSVMRSLDNINMLLYLGAFLIVVSAGIFVGYNFTTLTGTFKTVFLAIFAAVFYVAGLGLFLRTKKLRPAGITFTGIGLVMLPLVGLAAYNFTGLHSHGPATWLVTSLVTLVAYIATLIVTRQTYIAYLMAFTTLSMFESCVSVFNLPVYWFGWAMATVSIVLLTLSRTRLFWEDTAAALLLSANIFLPVAIMLSLFNAELGLTQLGVTLALAGAFYAAMANRFAQRSVSELYWSLSLLSLPAALGVGLWDTLSRSQIALLLLGICIAYVALEQLYAQKLPARWHELLGLITGMLPLAGITVVYDRPTYVLAILLAAVIINVRLALRMSQSALALIAILSLLAVPYIYARVYMDPALPWSMVATLLLVIAPVLYWWSMQVRQWPQNGREIGVFGYVSALGLALIAGAISSPTALMVTAYIVTLAAYGLSALERRPRYLYAAAASFYLALTQPAAIGNFSTNITALLLLASGAAIYALGLAAPSLKRSQVLRYAGIVGPFLGASTSSFYESSQLQPVAALAVGGGLLFVEARRQGNQLLVEVAGGIFIVSLNWYCSVLQITQTQIYTLPWAAYVAYLAYRRRGRGHQAYDGFTAAALGILTLPLATQALAEGGQLYGLVLVAEAILLIFAGMVLSYRLVTIWGAVTLVAEVLYQMREFFYALPKYLISAGLGVALLAVAIVMLLRRKSGE